MQKTVLLFILFTVALYARMVDGVAILVKEEPITLYAITQKMQEGGMTQAQAVDALIREKLESQEIAQRDLSVSETELQERIKQIAGQNNMTTAQLFDAVWKSEHLSRSAFEAKLKQSMLTQKLYSAVAMANMEEPGDEEMREYYRLHSEKFSHPETFDVTVYHASAQGALKRKMDNPMLMLPEVTMQEASLPYAKIEPQLAALLIKTEIGAYTPMLSDPKGGFVSFYIRNKSLPVMQPFETVKMQVQEEMMADAREQTLKDYFNRARLNAEITVIRLPNP
ncbi:peptidylprolyl isomerase [Sulfurimonas sp. HSL-3221]|uniref:peptidylprolyl isomerase n=1 Tax=Sulfurimonadaceae TaxID=2771471 RepID=UPI001E345819|nr:peptidylprolyl isomerase [Sulfurimonas sp. HSL-3221]UFS62428.1 peptidylprolyl isomerase [Sulfurimonas sp. HSL-3221]